MKDHIGAGTKSSYGGRFSRIGSHNVHTSRQRFRQPSTAIDQGHPASSFDQHIHDGQADRPGAKDDRPIALQGLGIAHVGLDPFQLLFLHWTGLQRSADLGCMLLKMEAIIVK